MYPSLLIRPFSKGHRRSLKNEADLPDRLLYSRHVFAFHKQVDVSGQSWIAVDGERNPAADGVFHFGHIKSVYHSNQLVVDVQAIVHGGIPGDFPPAIAATRSIIGLGELITLKVRTRTANGGRRKNEHGNNFH